MQTHAIRSFIIRWTALFIGLFLMGLGISLVTISQLGTSPISSAALVISYIVPLSFGTVTFLFSLLFILLQMVIDRQSLKVSLFLQVFIAPVFGYCIDLCMGFLRNVHPDSYVYKIFLLISGCFVLALGIVVQVKANAVMNPGEAFVKIIAQKANMRFGTVKTLFDSSLVLIAAVISLVFLQKIEGIREGTVISAIIVGFLAKGIDRLFLIITYPHKARNAL